MTRVLNHSKIWTLANLFSVVRVLLLPALIMTYSDGRYLSSFFIMILICLSDVLDGWIARKTDTSSRLGALVDITADCIIVFAFQIFLMRSGDWRLYLLVINGLSILVFIFRISRNGKVSKNRLGQYVGGLMMLLILVAVLCNMVDPLLWSRVIRFLGIPVAAFIVLTMFENLDVFPAKKRDNVGSTLPYPRKSMETRA